MTAPHIQKLLDLLGSASPVMLFLDSSKKFKKAQQMPVEKWDPLPPKHKQKIKDLIALKNTETLSPLTSEQCEPLYAEIQKLMVQKDVPKTEDTPDPKKEDAPDPKTEDTPDAKTEDTPDAKTEDTPDAKTEDTPDAKTEDAPEPKTEDTPEPNTEDTSEPNTEDTPEPNTEDTPEPNTEDTPEAKTEDTPEPKTEDIQTSVEETSSVSIEDIGSEAPDVVEEYSGTIEEDLTPNFVNVFFNYIKDLMKDENTAIAAPPDHSKETAFESENVTEPNEPSRPSTEDAHLASTVPNADQLPEGWTAQISTSSDPGKVYYVNEKTGETTWDKPEMPSTQDDAGETDGAADGTTNGTTDGAADESSNALPEGWTEHVSETSDPGKKYYVHEKTGETTWDRPSNPQKAESSSALPEGWTEHVSETSDPGKKYYVHEKTGETTWDKPGAKKVDESSTDSAGDSTGESAGDATADTEEVVPDGWSVHVSRTSDPGKKYYVNDRTGETTWDKPGEGHVENWVEKTSNNVRPGEKYYENTKTGDTSWSLIDVNGQNAAFTCMKCKKGGKLPHTTYFIKNDKAHKVRFCSMKCFEDTEF